MIDWDCTFWIRCNQGGPHDTRMDPLNANFNVERLLTRWVKRGATVSNDTNSSRRKTSGYLTLNINYLTSKCGLSGISKRFWRVI